MIQNWLHITYSFEGGLVAGVNYMTTGNFKVTHKLLEIELGHNPQLPTNDYRPLLRCVSLYVNETELHSTQEYNQVLQAFCMYSKQFKDCDGATFNSLKSTLHQTEESGCQKCGKAWNNHGALTNKRRRAGGTVRTQKRSS